MRTKIRFGMLITFLSIGALLIAACATATPQSDSSAEPAQSVEDEHMDEGEDEHMEGEDAHTEEEDEHLEGEDMHMEGEAHLHPDVPHEYEDLVNPFHDDADAVAAGAELFAVNCSTCHGDTGMGDGPAAAALDPMPASLADVEMMGEISDAYVFWRISEGGVNEPFNSAMPPWKTVFSEEQRWQLVNFVRTLAQ